MGLIKVQAAVVQRLDNAIHWINLYPVDNSAQYVNGTTDYEIKEL